MSEEMRVREEMGGMRGDGGKREDKRKVVLHFLE